MSRLAAAGTDSEVPPSSPGGRPVSPEGIEQLGDRHVPSAIARHILPKLPHPRSARLVRKELHAQVQQSEGRTTTARSA